VQKHIEQQKINEYLISSYLKADLIVSVVDVEGKKRITVTNKGVSAAKNIFIKNLRVLGWLYND